MVLCYLADQQDQLVLLILGLHYHHVIPQCQLVLDLQLVLRAQKDLEDQVVLDYPTLLVYPEDQLLQLILLVLVLH